MIAPRARTPVGLCIVLAAFGCTLDMSQKHDCRTNADCVGGRICVVGTCRAPDGSGGAGDLPNYAFVTSAPVSIRLQSLDAADEICASLAAAVPLSGQFRAWLSTSMTDARDRLENARGWIRPDGSPFADTLDDLTQGRIFNTLSLDEHGLPVSGVVVTGTDRDGHADAANDCDDWSATATTSATVGTTAGTTNVWTQIDEVACDQEARLYCFGVDRSAPVAPLAPRGKLAFLSEAPFAVGGGLAAADALCQGEADAAHLAGAFRALLASDGASASSRVQANVGAVWWRVDGVALNREGSGIFPDVGTLLAPLNVTSQKRYMDTSVFTGATGPNVAGVDADTCGGWVAGSGATAGRVNYLPSWFADGSRAPCETRMDIYCFQSD